MTRPRGMAGSAHLGGEVDPRPPGNGGAVAPGGAFYAGNMRAGAAVRNRILGTMAVFTLDIGQPRHLGIFGSKLCPVPRLAGGGIGPTGRRGHIVESAVVCPYGKIIPCGVAGEACSAVSRNSFYPPCKEGG